jgi:Protein of unknown function (DUF1360)
LTPTALVDQVPIVVWLLIDALAVYRLARLLTRDSFPPIARARERVLERWPESAWTELAVCPWCMSVWIAGPVIGARLLAPTPWSLLALLLAYSAVAGQLSERE